MIWHSSDKEVVLAELSVDENSGLANGVAYERLETYGKNQVADVKPISFIKQFLNQLNKKTVYALAIISALNLIISLIYDEHDYCFPVIVIALVVINALLCAYHLYTCDRAAYFQKNASVPTCTVIREGIKRSIPSNELVIGDIIILSEGDYINADARLIETNGFRCNELALTGEIIPVEKDANLVLDDMVPCAGRKNMVFCGCNVTHGSAKAVVVETGANTEISKSSALYSKPGNTVSGIERSLGAITHIVGIVLAVASAVIFLLGIVLGISSDTHFAAVTVKMLLNATALGFAAFPAVMPYVTAIVTSLGAARFIRSGVIIKDTATIEKLAKTTVLCADKTGVFTKNHMYLNSVYNGESLEYPVGGVLNQKCAVVLRLAVACSMLENDNTEAAIEESCVKYNNMSKADIDNAYPRLNSIPFDGERKMMTSINMIDGKPFAVVKGAPETVLSKCAGIDAEKVQKVCDELAEKSLRLICIAIKALEEIPANPNAQEIECDLKFAGIICLEDPPRVDAAESIEACKSAGIRVVMITGDNITTACSVAKNLGIIDDDAQAITGAQLEEIDDDELKQIVHDYCVFARISPAQKLRIVQALKDNGDIVTVTGNGLDDADVLSVSDVGFAIGADGNDVARGNADAIIKKNSFSAVVSVFKECHGLFENIKKTAHYLISICTAIMLIYLPVLLIFRTPPLSAVQLLWINLLANAVPVMSLATKPADSKTAIPTEKLLRGRLFDLNTVISIIIESVTLSVCCIAAFAIGKSTGISVGCTMAFLTASFAFVVHSFNLCSNRSIIFIRYKNSEFMVITSAVAVFVSAFLCLTPAGRILGLSCLSFGQVMICAGLSLIAVPVFEVIKLFNSGVLSSSKSGV